MLQHGQNLQVWHKSLSGFNILDLECTLDSRMPVVCIAMLCVGQGSQGMDTGVLLDETGWEGDGALPSTLKLQRGVQSMGTEKS